MPRYYIKEVHGCQTCPHFWDESETCHHPHWNRKTHVVNMYNGDVFIEGFTFPDDCPLEKCGDTLDTIKSLCKEVEVYDKALFVMCLKAGMSGEEMQELLRRCRLPLSEQIKEIQKEKSAK